MRLPIAGAMPIIFSSGLDGPKSCSHASATTCGAIIIGSTKQKTNALRARMSVSDTTSATTPPIATASSVPPSAVTRLCRVAVQVVELDRTRADRVRRESSPFGATPSSSRRASGSTDRMPTTSSSPHSSV